mgnify:CR=1 FL=1
MSREEALKRKLAEAREERKMKLGRLYAEINRVWEECEAKVFQAWSQHGART